MISYNSENHDSHEHEDIGLDQECFPLDFTNAPSDLLDAYISYFHFSMARNEYYKKDPYFALDTLDFFAEWWNRASPESKERCTAFWSAGFGSAEALAVWF